MLVTARCCAPPETAPVRELPEPAAWVLLVLSPPPLPPVQAAEIKYILGKVSQVQQGPKVGSAGVVCVPSLPPASYWDDLGYLSPTELGPSASRCVAQFVLEVDRFLTQWVSPRLLGRCMYLFIHSWPGVLWVCACPAALYSTRSLEGKGIHAVFITVHFHIKSA